jgi:aldehyde dehydrogenase (NAD+)
VQEETFGPTLTVTKVTDLAEAITLTNATAYGLAGSVFSTHRGVEIARQLRSGMTSINSVMAFAGVPGLPFGGSGASGFGRIHGEDGLREFTRAKAITRQRFALPLPLMSFQRTARTEGLLVTMIRLLHGRG